MKELREILDAYQKLKNRDETIALATIVKAKGSTYRRPGARMLLTRSGEMVGSISGGCLEGDVLERAKKVMESGAPVLVSYDTSSDDDLVWGLGLGCAGMVHVLLEPVNRDTSRTLTFLADCARQDHMGVLATVFRVEGSAGAGIGSRLMLSKNGGEQNHIEDGEVAAAVLRDAQEAMRTGRSTVKTYQAANGSAEVFIEVIQPALPLVILGAGHDAIPLVRLAKELGWNVTIVDSRPAFATKDRFPQADRIILCNPEEVSKRINIEENSAVVIMSHNYSHDRSYLQQLLAISTRYLGVLGPKKRTQQLLEELRKEDVSVSEEQAQRIYSPIGIDIGAENSEEIALSIVGEIQAVVAGRSGGLLRNRPGPIHERTDTT